MKMSQAMKEFKKAHPDNIKRFQKLIRAAFDVEIPQEAETFEQAARLTALSALRVRLFDKAHDLFKQMDGRYVSRIDELADMIRINRRQVALGEEMMISFMLDKKGGLKNDCKNSAAHLGQYDAGPCV